MATENQIEVKKILEKYYDIIVSEENIKYRNIKGGCGWYLFKEENYLKLDFDEDMFKETYIKNLFLYDYKKYLENKVILHNFLKENNFGEILEDFRTYFTLAIKGKSIYIFSDIYKLEELDTKQILRKKYYITSLPVINKTFSNSPITHFRTQCIFLLKEGNNYNLFSDDIMVRDYKEKRKYTSDYFPIQLTRLNVYDPDKGLYEKFKVFKYDEDRDNFYHSPEKFYFVLSLKRDKIALECLKLYRDKTENLNLKKDLALKIEEIESNKTEDPEYCSEELYDY